MNTASRLIKTIPKQIFSLNKLKYLQTLQKQVVKSTEGRKALEELVNKMGSTNAKTIARTEVARMQTAMLANRAKTLGCSYYLWRATNDRRTRKSHTKMRDVLVS